ncbi:MAG: hypothetical protein Q4G68_06020 [Planctomycetia bacterium]|nr:hypothetical protein [Planctomycetia bacterium]
MKTTRREFFEKAGLFSMPVMVPTLVLYNNSDEVPSDADGAVLELDTHRKITTGSPELLRNAVANGADLRIATGFRHNEHIDVTSQDDQLIVETSSFKQTVLINDRWVAGYMTLRQPVTLVNGFGQPNSLSLFLYNQNGQQALARVIFEDRPDSAFGKKLESEGVSKFHTFSQYDTESTGPSKNFVYDFDFYRYYVTEKYSFSYANDAKGNCKSGNFARLAQASEHGKTIKVGIRGISSYLWPEYQATDEIFIPCGSHYYYAKKKLMVASTEPFVVIPATIPLEYRANALRYCWAIVQSDASATIRSYDPIAKEWHDYQTSLPVRWFVEN